MTCAVNQSKPARLAPRAWSGRTLIADRVYFGVMEQLSERNEVFQQLLSQLVKLQKQKYRVVRDVPVGKQL